MSTFDVVLITGGDMFDWLDAMDAYWWRDTEYGDTYGL